MVVRKVVGDPAEGLSRSAGGAVGRAAAIRWRDAGEGFGGAAAIRWRGSRMLFWKGGRMAVSFVCFWFFLRFSRGFPEGQ